jgi:hypothetical protein
MPLDATVSWPPEPTLHLPRPGEPESALVPGMAAPRADVTTERSRIVALPALAFADQFAVTPPFVPSGAADLGGNVPWTYWQDKNGVSHAAFAGIIDALNLAPGAIVAPAFTGPVSILGGAAASLTIGDVAAQNAITLTPGATPASNAFWTPAGSGGLVLGIKGGQLSIGDLTATNFVRVVIGATPASVSNITPGGSGGHLTFTPSGTAGRVVGNTDAVTPPAGSVGEIMQQTVAAGSAVNLSTTVGATIASLNLTAGDWDVWGNVAWTVTGATTTLATAWLSTSAPPAVPTAPNSGGMVVSSAALVSGQCTLAGNLRLASTAAQTVYLGARATFPSGTVAAYGYIAARRRR